MRAIKTRRNIECLQAARALEPSLSSFLWDLWSGLCTALFPDRADSDCDLTEVGYIVLLEKGDDVRDLRHVGLTNGGLFGSRPEFVEVIKTDGGLVYKVASLYNNECLMLFVLRSGDFDEQTDRWLREEAGLGPCDGGIIASNKRERGEVLSNTVNLIGELEILRTELQNLVAQGKPLSSEEVQSLSRRIDRLVALYHTVKPAKPN